MSSWRRVIRHNMLFVGMVAVIVVLLVSVTAAFIYGSPSNHRNVYASHGHRSPVIVASLTHASTQNLNAVTDQSVTTTGCGQALTLKNGMTTDVDVTSSHQKRSYLLYLPSQYSNDTPHAVVLNFHGYKANDYIQEAVSQFNPVANAHNAIVVYPDGSFGSSGYRGWDTGLHPGVTANDVLFVSDLLDQLQSNLCIQSTQIYATGLSNGGGFVNLLACDLSNRIAAFAPVSGSYVTPPQDCHIKQPVSMLEFHGTADSVNPYNGDPAKHEAPISNWIDSWLSRDNCSITPTVTKANINTVVYNWSSCNGQASVVHYKIVGEGHQWPTELFQQTNGSKTQQVTAAGVMWQFFSQHPLKTSAIAG